MIVEVVVDKVIVKVDYEYEEQENMEDNDRGGQDVCKVSTSADTSCLALLAW